ncbi:hypothetical protein CSKR_106987 [Clonorchis sinensis]|uniref:Uncharacterized protein n=1 Tax=Clonorchis sinensis TaxID=79923 RepID=A0A419Q5X4_CLOSI|nr:hypothetical protein CSKR_106987 [Clonorchis sinensis]
MCAVAQWLECEFTDWKVRRLNPTSASPLLLSRPGQPDSIPALVLLPGGMAARHRKYVAAERLYIFYIVSETRIQDAGTVVELTGRSTRFRLRTSGNPEAAAAGCTRVGIVLSHRTEGSLLDWIPSDSLLCVALSGSVGERVSQAGRPHKVRTIHLATERLADTDFRRTCRSRLLESLPTTPPSDVHSYWDAIATSLHSAWSFAFGMQIRTQAGRTQALAIRPNCATAYWRNIPAGSEHNLDRRIIGLQVKVSVRAYREVWPTRKAREMEDAQKADNA